MTIVAGPWNLRAETCTDQDGIELRVPGLIPGDVAQIHVTGRSQGGPVAWGEIESIERSSRRRSPPCAIHGECGGCGLQYVREEARLKHLVAGHTPRLPAALLEVLAPEEDWIRSPGFGWRHKAVFLPGWKGGNVTLGAYARGSHDIVDQPKCNVLAPYLREARKALLPMIEERANAGMALAPPGSKGKRGLRALVLRANRSGQVLGTAIVRSEEDASRLGPYMRNAVTDGLLAGAFVQVTASGSDAVHGREPAQHVGGLRFLLEDIAGVTLPVLPLAFFQVNPGVLEQIVQLSRAQLGEAPGILLDAYCGVGALGIALAAGSEAPPLLVGCDVVKSAVDAAAKAAEHHGLSARYVLGTPTDMGPLSPDVALVDPPRKGCSAAELTSILDAEPGRIIYLSCHVGSLARDAERILAAGYKPVGLWPADMLPQTAHLELVAVFER